MQPQEIQAAVRHFNLGCSGFVYGLSIAKELIETARSVLLLTSDTFSKYIYPADKSTRTLLGVRAFAAPAVVTY